MEITKRTVRTKLDSAHEQSFKNVNDLRRWINNERFADEDEITLYAEVYDEDEAEVVFEIYNVREETDAEFAKRFNEAMERKLKREAEQKADRFETFQRLKAEFEQQEQNG